MSLSEEEGKQIGPTHTGASVKFSGKIERATRALQLPPGQGRPKSVTLPRSEDVPVVVALTQAVPAGLQSGTTTFTVSLDDAGDNSMVVG
jgi:hypothetical protein